MTFIVLLFQLKLHSFSAELIAHRADGSRIKVILILVISRAGRLAQRWVHLCTSILGLAPITSKTRFSPSLFYQVNTQRQTYLSFTKEVGEVLHRIAANAGNILIASRFRGTQWLDTISNIIRHFHTDLHSQHELIREKWRQLHWEEQKLNRNTNRDMTAEDRRLI